MSARASIIPVFVPHWGCTHACVFCNQRHITGKREPATARTVEQAMLQAAALPSGAKRQLAFYGGSFTAIPAAEQEALLASAQAFIRSGEISSLRLSTRPDAIDEAVLERLRRCGVKTIELGAQSMDDRVLAASGRGHTAVDVEHAARLVKGAGFELILQMMTGLPASTDESDIKTARRLIALHPDGVRIYPTVIVEDTALCELWRTGRYREHSVEDAVRVCARILPLFEEAAIPVIRLGLNPSEELSGGAAVAGAYHPALGELVQSRLFRDRAEALLAGTEPGSRVILGVNAHDLSRMIGQHRANLAWLRERFSLAELEVRPAAVKNGEICRIFLEN